MANGMRRFFMRFPGGRVKTLTLSYDDNVEADVKLIQIMKKHGLKALSTLTAVSILLRIPLVPWAAATAV